jgi:hypothetical protein
MICLDTVFTEPLLEFGKDGVSCDIREGILKYGPLDVGAPKAKTSVRLGLIGTPKTVCAFSAWMKKCSEGLGGDDPQNENFNPRFPGLAPNVGFRCSFLTDPSWVTEIDEGGLKAMCAKPGAVMLLAELFHKHIHGLCELSSARPDVILCLPPETVRKRVKPNLGDEEDSRREDEESGEPDFHDYLKGLCLQTKFTVQLIWPRTYTGDSKRVQDPATRAWNLFGALFYKAGGIPWICLSR